jgi:hypothetical protein
MNDRFIVIVQENTENGFARSGIVGTIKRESRPRKSLIALLCAFPQPRDRLSHRLRPNEKEMISPSYFVKVSAVSHGRVL